MIYLERLADENDCCTSIILFSATFLYTSAGSDLQQSVILFYPTMSNVLTARALLTEDGPIDFPVIRVEEGSIVSIEAGERNGSTETLTPAFFDIHVHGAMSHDFMAADQAGIHAIGRFLATRGVSHYLATTVTGPIDDTLRALTRVADAVEAGAGDGSAAVPAGVHLEGPFVSHAKRGVHPVKSLLAPDIPLFDRFQQAARGSIKLMTLAPELPGAIDLIQHACAAGVRISVGHSNATAAETLAAIAAGASSATHTFNAMRALDHREPGILGVVLDSDELYAEAICDGIHVHPSMVRLWLRAKGKDRAMLVTDGMSACGMPEGHYRLGNLDVEVKDGVCVSGGVLAGSVLTMDRAVDNLRAFTGASLDLAVRLASRNPAHMLGMPELTRIAPGAPANFNCYNAEGQRTGGILHGRPTGG